MSTKPRDNRLILLGLGLVLVWLVYDRQQLRQQLASHGSTASELEETAAAITASLKDNKTKARELARFYSALGGILKRDRGIVATTGIFREAHGRALDLAFRDTPTAGKPSVGAVVDELLFAAMGKENTPLDEQGRQQLQAAVAAIQKACEAVR